MSNRSCSRLTACQDAPFPALLADAAGQLRRDEGPALGAHLAHHLDDRPVLLRTGQQVVDGFNTGNACSLQRSHHQHA